MANNSHFNLKDYVSDINRKREGSNTLFNDITVRIFKIATSRLTDKYQGCQILRQTRLEKKIWGFPLIMPQGNYSLLEGDIRAMI